MKSKKAQIPVVFVFIFAIIVAGLLLTWGVSSIFRIIKTSEDAAYMKSITDFKLETSKMFSYEPGSTAKITQQFPSSITQICFTNHELNINPGTNQELKFLIENSDYNMFVIPLDSFEQTGLKIPNLKGKTNPECIEIKNSKLNAKLTTMNKYVQIESIQ